MTEQQDRDEQLLIDFVLGRCDPAEAQVVRSRLEADEVFRARHQDIRNALAAMELIPPAEPPAALAERTINHLRQVHATEALIARASSRPRRTFSQKMSSVMKTWGVRIRVNSSTTRSGDFSRKLHPWNFQTEQKLHRNGQPRAVSSNASGRRKLM